MASRQEIRVSQAALISELRKVNAYTKMIIQWGERQQQLRQEQQREEFKKLNFFKRQLFRYRKFLVDRKTKNIIRQ